MEELYVWMVVLTRQFDRKVSFDTLNPKTRVEYLPVQTVQRVDTEANTAHLDLQRMVGGDDLRA
jgi:hypothetical protein